MVYNKFIGILFVLYSKVLSSESFNETDQKYTLNQYNDSVFYVQDLNDKSETNKDIYLKEWAFSPSTVNAILENVLKFNHSVSPKKREATLGDAPFPLNNKWLDQFYTVRNETMDENFDVTDLYIPGKQANSSAEDVGRKSVLSALQKNSAKVLLEKGEITVRPMPFLTDSNRNIIQSKSEISKPHKTTPSYINTSEGILSPVDNIKTQTSEIINRLNSTEILITVDTSTKLTPFNIDGSGGRSSSAIETVTSNAIQGTYPTNIFENVSQTVTYPSSSITSTDNNKYTNTIYENASNFNLNNLNPTTEDFISTDNLASTFLVDFKLKNDNAHNFRTKSTNGKELYDISTTSTFSTFNTDKSFFKVDEETKSTFIRASTVSSTKLKSSQPPTLFTKGNQNKITTEEEFLSTGPSTSYINVNGITLDNKPQSQNKSIKTKPNIREEFTSATVPKVASSDSTVSQSFTDGKSFSYESSSVKSSSSIPVTTTPEASTSSSNSTEILMGNVNIVPVGQKDNQVLLIGIVLSCLASIALVSILIVFCYQKRKKATTNELEMTHAQFDEV